MKRKWNHKKATANILMLGITVCLLWVCIGALPGAIDVELDRMKAPAPALYDKSEIPDEGVMPDGTAEKGFTEPKPDNVIAPPVVGPGANTITMETTAYCPTCGTGDGLTATGTQVREGVVAVDPAVIPYGSVVEIVDVGTFTAEDTGGAIRGDRIDIFMNDRGDCLRWGRQTVQVRILEEGKGI